MADIFRKVVATSAPLPYGEPPSWRLAGTTDVSPVAMPRRQSRRNVKTVQSCFPRDDSTALICRNASASVSGFHPCHFAHTQIESRVVGGHLPSVRMAVDLALAGTERRGIGIVYQQKLQLVNAHPIDVLLFLFLRAFAAATIKKRQMRSPLTSHVVRSGRGCSRSRWRWNRTRCTCCRRGRGGASSWANGSSPSHNSSSRTTRRASRHRGVHACRWGCGSSRSHSSRFRSICISCSPFPPTVTV